MYWEMEEEREHYTSLQHSTDVRLIDSRERSSVARLGRTLRSHNPHFRTRYHRTRCTNCLRTHDTTRSHISIGDGEGFLA